MSQREDWLTDSGMDHCMNGGVIVEGGGEGRNCVWLIFRDLSAVARHNGLFSYKRHPEEGRQGDSVSEASDS